jgi:protein tyrosine phosphatase (PTP) superfamily phosphohydrolase (DUF442 family)
MFGSPFFCSISLKAPVEKLMDFPDRFNYNCCSELNMVGHWLLCATCSEREKLRMALSELEGIYNYKKLDDRITTAGQPLETEIPAIPAAGFEVLIYLGLFKAENDVPEEPRILERQGMIFEHIPVVWENPLPGDFAKFCAVMAKYRKHRLFIHCVANMRVSVFMALYRMVEDNWDYEAAMMDIHDIWKPNETWMKFIDRISGREKYLEQLS